MRSHVFSCVCVYVRKDSLEQRYTLHFNMVFMTMERIKFSHCNFDRIEYLCVASILVNAFVLCMHFLFPQQETKRANFFGIFCEATKQKKIILEAQAYACNCTVQCVHGSIERAHRVDTVCIEMLFIASRGLLCSFHSC